jgi:thiamine-phosphate pyrophosphorylase
VVCDEEVCASAGWTLADYASACLDGGARLLQIRAKRASASAFLEASRRVVQLARGCNALVVVNDRADIARLAGAGGVHVGQDDLTPAAVRTLVAAEAVVGLSTHAAGQRRHALRQPVNYIAVGPVFATGTKATGYPPVGPGEVRRAADEISAALDWSPALVGIGGITLANARAVIDAGARSVAVISDLLVGNDPANRVRQFLRALGEWN